MITTQLTSHASRRVSSATVAALVPCRQYSCTCSAHPTAPTAASLLCLAPLKQHASMRDVRRSRVQQRMYCSKADKKGVWSELKKQAEEAANVEVDEADVSPEMIPKTFKEYLQYCKIIGTLDMPAVLSKEGQPSSAVGVMEALDELHMLHLVKDDELFYLILVGWGADLAKYRFRVFNRAEREKSFKELLQWVVKIESLGHKEKAPRGPKTNAALLQVASTAGLTEQCIAQYEQALKSGTVTRYLLPCMTYAFAKSATQSHMDHAREVFNFCNANSFRQEDYKSFIYACSRVGNWRDARYYYENYKKDFKIGLTGVNGIKTAKEERLMTMLLTAYSRGRNPGGALEVYNDISAKYTPKDIQCSAMLAAYATGSIRHYNASRMLFLRSHDITYTHSATAWMKVMVALANNLEQACMGEPRDAVERLILDKLGKADGFKQRTMMQQRAFFRHKHLCARFWKFFDVMKKFSSHYKPDAVTYYHALQFAATTGDTANALLMLKEIEAAGMDHITYYNLVIRAHAKVSDVKAVIELFKKLRAKKLSADINTYAAIIHSLVPGTGTNSAIAIVENMSHTTLNSTFLAGAVRAFGVKNGVRHLVELLRMGVSQSSGDDMSDYVMDNAMMWGNLETAFEDKELYNMFMEEYPDFDERAFEVVSGPSLHMLSPRPVTTNIEDFKALMATGKSVWILSDEWMLPLGDKLKDYIEDVLAAKDKIVIPFYCLVRLGKLVRRNQGNNLVRQAAFNVLVVLQELFDESARQTARKEVPTVDTIYFSEMAWANTQLQRCIDAQPQSAREKEIEEKLKETPPIYDLELSSDKALTNLLSLKMLSRRCVTAGSLIQQFQMQGRNSVFFCGRDKGHLELAKKLGMEPISVEEVLGEGWLKQRAVEDTKLMLSWRAEETPLALGEAAVEVPALTATSFSENEYERSLLSEVAAEQQKAEEAARDAKRKRIEAAQALKEEQAASFASKSEVKQEVVQEDEEPQKPKKDKKQKKKPDQLTTAESIAALKRDQADSSAPTAWASQRVLRGRSASAEPESEQTSDTPVPKQTGGWSEQKIMRGAGAKVEEGNVEPAVEEKEAVPASVEPVDASVSEHSSDVEPKKKSSWGKVKPKKAADTEVEEVANFEPAATPAEPASVEADVKADTEEATEPATDTPAPISEDTLVPPSSTAEPVDAPAPEQTSEAAPKKKSSWGKVKPKKAADTEVEEVANFEPAATPAEPASVEADVKADTEEATEPATDTPAPILEDTPAPPSPTVEPVDASAPEQTSDVEPKKKSSWGKVKPKKAADTEVEEVANFEPAATPAEPASVEADVKADTEEATEPATDTSAPTEDTPAPPSTAEPVDAPAPEHTSDVEPKKKSSWGKVKPKKAADTEVEEVANFEPAATPAEPASVEADAKADTEEATEPATDTPAPISEDTLVPPSSTAEPVDAPAPEQTSEAAPKKKSSWGKVKPKKAADTEVEEVANFEPTNNASDPKPNEK